MKISQTFVAFSEYMNFKVRLRDNHNNGYVVKTVRKKQTFVLISLLFRDFGQVTNLNLTVICEMYQGMENPTSY